MRIVVTLMVSVLLLAASVGPALAEKATGTAPSAAQPCPTTDVMSRLLLGQFDYCVARKRWAEDDYAGARKMLLISARWANKNAQLALGMAYLNGVGFKQDRPLGLAWLSLACERHVAVYQGICDAATQGASASERHLAAQQLAQLQSRYSDAAVADRAYRQYQTASTEMLGNPVYGGPCLAGLDLIVAANSSTRMAVGSERK